MLAETSDYLAIQEALDLMCKQGLHPYQSRARNLLLSISMPSY